MALWESGWYEARLLAALVGDPARVTPRQMNAWAARLISAANRVPSKACIITPRRCGSNF